MMAKQATNVAIRIIAGQLLERVLNVTFTVPFGVVFKLDWRK